MIMKVVNDSAADVLVLSLVKPVRQIFVMVLNVKMAELALLKQGMEYGRRLANVLIILKVSNVTVNQVMLLLEIFVKKHAHLALVRK